MAIRPLTNVREGYAESRDGRFALVHGHGVWQVRSLDSAGAQVIRNLVEPREHVTRRESAEWLEDVCA